MLAVRRNAQHGLQLTPEEKQNYAVLWWRVRPDEEICDTLSISQATFARWTQDKRQAREKQIKQAIFDMWLRCHTQQEIAEVVGVDQASISRQIDEIAENMQNGQMTDLHIFRDFAPELYSIWNFAKATNEVKHFGNIPPEICGCH